VAIERGLNLNVGKEGQEREIKIKLPEGASLVSILAMNRNAPSVAATARVSTLPARRGTRIVGQEKSNAPKPMLYVLAIGVGKYSDASGLPTLTFPAKDAKDFASAMLGQKGLRYKDVMTKVFPDATHDQIMDGLEWISGVTKENDVAMIFLAGHGITDGADFYYFMPSDGELDHPKKRGVPFAEIENTLVSLKGQKILFVDTCRSGAVLGRRGIIDINGIANKLNRETSGVAVFTASMGNESAEESSEWNNGAFTRALLDALSGQADLDHTGEISFSMLEHFITKRVRDLTHNRQTPTATKPLTVPDFLLAALH
ncbi:MAG: caspase family protein, partial [Acidobacteriota bacterium]|nr:caspase family protein [Acidobacteriota bacterium]